MLRLPGCLVSVLMVVVVVVSQDGPFFQGDSGVENLPYPTFYTVPDTGFSCQGRWGLYPDPEAGCQAFHFCYGYRMNSFLCPNATLFSENYRICDHYYNVPCRELQD